MSKTKHKTHLKLTPDIRKSGLLATLTPEELETLITLSTFSDEKGKLKITGQKLAQALNLSPRQALSRLNKLCQIRWQGRPLLVKVFDNLKFKPNHYRLYLPPGLAFIQDGVRKPPTDADIIFRTPVKPRDADCPQKPTLLKPNVVVKPAGTQVIARQKNIQAIKARMSPQELTQFREQAKQKLTRILHQTYTKDTLPESLIDGEVNYLIARKYSAETKSPN